MSEIPSGSSCPVKPGWPAKARILIGSVAACTLLGLALGDVRSGFVIGLIVGAAFSGGG